MSNSFNDFENIYNELKTNTCNIVPVIEVDKVLLTN